MFELLPESEPTPVPLPKRRPFTVHACLRARVFYEMARDEVDYYRDGRLRSQHEANDHGITNITMCGGGEAEGSPCEWRPVHGAERHRLNGGCVAESVQIDYSDLEEADLD